MERAAETWTGDDVALLDFGDGRRLERFGPFVLDRPAPAVAGVARLDPDAWRAADARFDRPTGGRSGGAPDTPGGIALRDAAAGAGAAAGRGAGTWIPATALPTAWTVGVQGLTLELRPTATGQVGLFPEHAGPAVEVATIAGALASRLGRQPEALNLFAYTGLATLLLARAGARVAHVDASRPAVAWARRNADLSGLDAAPIRWLVDDAAAFCAREVRRGRHYDIVVLDPPTYGHAPHGGGWRIDAGLAALLAACAALTGPRPGAVLLTAHTAGMAAGLLRDAVAAAWGAGFAATTTTRPLGLARPDGARLPAGTCVILAP